MIPLALVVLLALLLAVWSGQLLKAQTRPGNGLTVRFWQTAGGWRCKYVVGGKEQYVPGVYPREVDALREFAKTFERGER